MTFLKLDMNCIAQDFAKIGLVIPNVGIETWYMTNTPASFKQGPDDFLKHYFNCTVLKAAPLLYFN
jgi:hypothetical protein